MPLFSSLPSSSLRYFLPLARSNGFSSAPLLLKRSVHQIFHEPYKEIQRSSSEKLISAKIVGELIKLWGRKNDKQGLKIIDIGSHDATMLTHCLTQANLSNHHQVSLLAIDKENDIIDSAGNTLAVFTKDKKNMQYATLVADIFSPDFLHQNNLLFPKANIMLLMNVLYGTKEQTVKSLFNILQENFLAENGIIISAHAAETPNGVINLINQYAYHSKQLGEEENDQPSLIKNIVGASGLNMANCVGLFAYISVFLPKQNGKY